MIIFLRALLEYMLQVPVSHSQPPLRQVKTSLRSLPTINSIWSVTCMPHPAVLRFKGEYHPPQLLLLTYLSLVSHHTLPWFIFHFNYFHCSCFEITRKLRSPLRAGFMVEDTFVLTVCVLLSRAQRSPSPFLFASHLPQSALPFVLT